MLLSVLWTRLGFGAKPRQAYHKLHNSVTGFAVEWSRRQRGTGDFPVPRCRLWNDTAKIQRVQGFKGGENFECLSQNFTTRPLHPLNRWNGRVCVTRPLGVLAFCRRQAARTLTSRRRIGQST